MQDQYLKKIDRVTAILTQLQSKPIVRAQDLSEKFDVSIRTIYRDIKTLENAGIPIVGEAGNGYSLMDGYKLPPVMFTKEEVLSFITAEKLMQKFSHESLGKHYQSAMEKVKSVLRSSDKKLIQNIENQIGIYNHRPAEEDLVKNSIPLLLESIAEKKQLRLGYRNINGDITERIIEAVGIFFEFSCWYVWAFCTMRNDFRQFRVDRFQNLQKLDISFGSEYGNINDYRNRDKNPKVEVQLLIDKEVMTHLSNSKKYYGLTKEEKTENGILLTFETEWLEDSFLRWIITFADYMEIIYPESLKDGLTSLIDKMNLRLQESKK